MRKVIGSNSLCAEIEADLADEIEQLKKQYECDPKAITIAELMALVPDMTDDDAQKEMAKRIKSGKWEKCWKRVKGNRKPAYRKVKK